MSTSTTVNNLKINKLTKAQYDAIQSPSETELYLVEEEDNKEDKVDIVSASGTTLSAQVGKYYTLTGVGTLAITLPTIASGTTKVQTVSFYIAAGSSPGVTFTSTHTIIYPKDYTIEANGLYEVSAAWNGIGWIIGQLTLEIPT